MKKRIEAAIRLILGNVGEDWFIILEEPVEEKFVQFIYDEQAGLIFDLPFQALTKDELERAQQTLSAMGVETDDSLLCEENSQQQSFSVMIGRDLAQAVELVEKVFTYVYGFDETTKFNVTINR